MSNFTELSALSIGLGILTAAMLTAVFVWLLFHFYYFIEELRKWE